MEEFVFKKWDYGLTSLSGYFSRRYTLPNLKKYVKYEIGVTNNKIPIYKWNWGMWFQIFINERRKPRKSMGTVDYIMGPVQSETNTKREDRKPDKEFV